MSNSAMDRIIDLEKQMSEMKNELDCVIDYLHQYKSKMDEKVEKVEKVEKIEEEVKFKMGDQVKVLSTPLTIKCGTAGMTGTVVSEKLLESWVHVQLHEVDEIYFYEVSVLKKIYPCPVKNCSTCDWYENLVKYTIPGPHGVELARLFGGCKLLKESATLVYCMDEDFKYWKELKK